MESAHRVSCTPGPRGKSSDLRRSWAQPNCWYSRVSCGGRGWLWLTVGTRILVAVVLGSVHWREPSRNHHFLTNTWLQPTACRLQCWNTTTNRVGTQPHPSADRLPKVVLSPQLLTKHPLTQPCPPEGQDPAPPTSRQESTHQEACTSLLDQPYPPGDKQQKQKELQPCSLQNRNCNHRKLDKMRWQRNISQMTKEQKKPQNNN